ncbi:uncharacterized protein CANTADRAFT_90282 [Suhomyces tanzawaensis NRRL Y-17324]|uniref:RRM domain-containing protein n=1 Tax=Suhomyces tanzawaensis NRRL Y-17324 TaxID=984487 RepID=A0A1E4SI35_9ASCO|nr:uncharacterized protein CANTADRAFT_90282 [Suhomyces tanzawaensis NRRL Y-17324]ODV79178.1 hypothetical protein CANTADRAFT_90282 [Suhomyces tanzawaensis NRRL Y-17324]
MSKHALEPVASVAKKVKLDPENLKPSQTLYLKNLNDQINPTLIKHSLYLLFSTYGDIVEIHNRKRGQAHVVFDSVVHAGLAMKCLQSEEFFNKALVIQYSKNESKVVTRYKDES